LAFSSLQFEKWQAQPCPTKLIGRVLEECQILLFSKSRPGFFGFGRRYTADALITIEKAGDFEADWSKALSEIAAWRRKPGGSAPIFSINLTVWRHLVSQVASHVVNVLVSHRDQFPPELIGFQIEVAIWDESLLQHLGFTVFPALHNEDPDSTG
jgi:hypothetical protein